MGYCYVEKSALEGCREGAGRGGRAYEDLRLDTHGTTVLAGD